MQKFEYAGLDSFFTEIPNKNL